MKVYLVIIDMDMDKSYDARIHITLQQFYLRDWSQHNTCFYEML